MKRRLVVVLSVLLLLATASAGSASSSRFGGTPRNVAITDFGGDRWRNHYSSEPWGFPMCASWAVDLGASASQPLHVNDRIYHLAGDSLWALRALDSLPEDLTNEEAKERLVIWRKQGLQSTISYSHPTYVDQVVRTFDGTEYRGVIYAGTGRVPKEDGTPGKPSLVAVAAEDGTLLARIELPDEIVSAPLAFPDGTIVFGTVNGYVWSVKDMADARRGTNMQIFWERLGGRVSSSPVPFGEDAFVIGTDGAEGEGGGGRVMAYSLELEELWARPDGSPDYVYTPRGVAASFAEVEDNVIYFSDKSGMFYAVDMRPGVIRWIGSGASGFINNSPAVDEDRVYFTLRRSSDTGKGKLVAYPRRGDGNLREPAWVADLPAEGNTAPMVWGPAGAILVGDTSGKITAWSAEDGKPVPFATDLTCHEAGHLRTFWQRIGGSGREMLKSEITLTNNPFRDTIGWGQASGAGTELTLSNGLLLAGANGAGKDVFLAFRHGGQQNLELTGGIAEDGPFEPGQRLTAQMHIVNYGRESRRQVIVHGWTGGQPVFTFVDIAPNADFWLSVETPPVPDTDNATYMAVVNPFFLDFVRRGGNWQWEQVPPLPGTWEPYLYGTADLPQRVLDGLNRMDATGDAVVYELEARDNYWRQNLPIKPPINLALTDVYAPSTIPAPQPPAHPKYSVSLRVNNESDRSIQTSIRLVVYSTAVNGGQIEVPVTLPPGVSWHAATVPGSSAGDTIRVVATLNPDRTIGESDYGDNTASAVTQVEGTTAIDPGDGYGKVDDVLKW